MALWKITVKRKVNTGGVRLEEGMFVEFPHESINNPLFYRRQQIVPVVKNLFRNKYGVDAERYIDTAYMECEKIS